MFDSVTVLCDVHCREFIGEGEAEGESPAHLLVCSPDACSGQDSGTEFRSHTRVEEAVTSTASQGLCWETGVRS